MLTFLYNYYTASNGYAYPNLKAYQVLCNVEKVCPVRSHAVCNIIFEIADW